MFGKRRYIFGILMIFSLLLLTGCSVRKNVRIKKVKDFTESTLESNEKIKSLDFYFIRPYLGANLVYDSDLDEREVEDLLDEFKTLIDIDFMQEIGDKYWKGIRPHEFSLYVYIDERNEETDNYKYHFYTDYNKTFNANEIPENIDGYQTWFGYDKITGEFIIDESEKLDWGIELDAKDVTPSGLILICKQSNGELEGEYTTLRLDDALELKEDKYIPVPSDDLYINPISYPHLPRF